MARPLGGQSRSQRADLRAVVLVEALPAYLRQEIGIFAWLWGLLRASMVKMLAVKCVLTAQEELFKWSIICT